MKKFYSVKEASEILGFSTNTVYKHLEEGKLKGRRLGKGRFKIPYSELAPYIVQEGSVTVAIDRQSFVAPVQDALGKLQTGVTETTSVISHELKGEVAKNGNVVFGLFVALSTLGLGFIYLSPFLIPLGALLVGISLFPNHLAKLINFGGHTNGVSYGIRLLTVLALVYTAYLSYLSVDYFGMVVIASLVVATVPRKGSSLFKDFMLVTTALFVFGGIAAFFTVPAVQENPVIFIFVLVGLTLLPVSLMYNSDNVGGTKIHSLLLPIVAIASFGLGMFLLVNSVFAASFFAFFYAILSVFVLWESSNKGKVALPSITPMVFGWIGLVILLGLFVVNVMQESTKRSAKENMDEALSLKAGEIDLYFDHLESEVNTTLSESRDGDSYDLAKEIFNNLDGVSKVGVIDSVGYTKAIYPRNEKVVGEYVGSDSYLQKTKDTLRSYVTPYSNSVLNGQGVYATSPTFINNDIERIFFVGIDLEDLSYKYQSSMDNSRFYAVDENGKYVMHADTDRIGEKFEEEDTSAVKVQTTAKNPRWTLYMELPKEEVMKSISMISIMVSIIIIVNSAFSLAVFLFLPAKGAFK